MADLDASRSKSFDFTQELTKQLITLSKGVIALTITFRHDIVGAGHGTTALLGIAWIAFILCVVSGVGVMMTLAGNLDGPGPHTIYAGNTKFFASAQVVTFVAGIAMTIAYGFTAL